MDPKRCVVKQSNGDRESKRRKAGGVTTNKQTNEKKKYIYIYIYKTKRKKEKVAA